MVLAVGRLGVLTGIPLSTYAAPVIKAAYSRCWMWITDAARLRGWSSGGERRSSAKRGWEERDE